MSKKEVSTKIGTEKPLILKIIKRKRTFLGRIMKKENLKNLTLTVHIEGRWGREKLGLLPEKWYKDLKIIKMQ